MSQEKHPFIFGDDPDTKDGYFMPANAYKLILGSFPCLSNGSYGEWFYCGSGRNFFWKLMSEIYAMPVGSKEEMKELLTKNGFGMSDIYLQIKRKKHKRKKQNCSDANLDVIQCNKDAIKECLKQGQGNKKKGIKKIYFTSKHVQNKFEAMGIDNGIEKITLLSPSPVIRIPKEKRLEAYKKAFEK